MVLTIAVPIRDIHFRMAVTQSNKKEINPLTPVRDLLTFTQIQPYRVLQPYTAREHHAPIHLSNAFSSVSVSRLTALPAQAEEQKNGTLPPALETALSTLLADAPQGKADPDAATVNAVLDFVATNKQAANKVRPEARPQGSWRVSQGNAQRPAPQACRVHARSLHPRRGHLPLRRAP